MFFPIPNCFEKLKMIVAQDYRVLLVLLGAGLWQFQQGQGRDLRKIQNYEISSTEAEVKIALYCEVKSTLKALDHFHKKMCLKRNNKLYTKYCERLSHRKSKSCPHFIKKLERVIKGNLGPQARGLMLQNSKKLCGNKKVGRRLEFYNASEYVCCKGKVHRRRNKDRELVCCGETVVDKSEKICCDGQNYVRTSVEETCCGNKVYNTSEHFCHEDHLYDRSEDGNVTSPHRHNRNNDSTELEYNITDPSANYEARNEGDAQIANDEISDRTTFLISVLGVILSFAFVLFLGLVVYKHIREKRISKREADDRYTVSCIVSSIASMPSDGIQHDIVSTNSPLVNRGKISEQSCSSLGQNTCPVTINSPPTAHEADSSVVVHRSYHATNKENNRSRRRSGESLHSHVSLRLEDFIKDSKINKENFTKNLIKDSSTQTCPPKATNRRDIFGKAFHYTGCLTRKNPFIQLKHSDAKMTLSTKDLSLHDIEVNASSHTDIPEIKKKMGFSDDYYQITSPCMEYDLPGIDKLEDFAVIEMKLVQRKNDQIQIWRMTSEEDGGQTFEIPVVKSLQPNLDTFCLLINGKAFIYTKIFSTYVCTTHNTHSEIDLWGLLYAKMTSSPIRAVLTLYVVERLHVEVKDYRDKLDRTEMNYGMRRIDDNRVPLPDRVKDIDKIIVRLSIDDRESWDFIRDPHNSDEEYDTHELSLCDICCQKRSVETSKCKWQMENINQKEPDIFRGHFYVKTSAEEREKRVFTVDEAVDEAVKRVPVDNLSQDLVRRELSKTPVCSVDQHSGLYNELSCSGEQFLYTRRFMRK